MHVLSRTYLVACSRILSESVTKDNHEECTACNIIPSRRVRLQTQAVDRKLRKMVSRVEEGNEDAVQLLTRVSHSHHSHVATPPRPPVNTRRWPGPAA
jgi:hypothetical protein